MLSTCYLLVRLRIRGWACDVISKACPRILPPSAKRAASLTDLYAAITATRYSDANFADMASGYGLAGGECASGHLFVHCKALVAVQWQCDVSKLSNSQVHHAAFPSGKSC